MHAALLTWLDRQQVPELQALSTDQAWRQALQDVGWRYSYSSFDLFRAARGWTLAAPSWPDGITISGLRAVDVAATHELIYVQASWAQTLEHHERFFADWYAHFLAADDAPKEHVLAWRREPLVGCSIGRSFFDGTDGSRSMLWQAMSAGRAWVGHSVGKLAPP